MSEPSYMLLSSSSDIPDKKPRIQKSNKPKSKPSSESSEQQESSESHESIGSRYSLRSQSSNTSDKPTKKSEPLNLNIKSDKTKKICSKYKMKSPPPGCNGVEGCKWVPGRGNGCKDISELKTEDKIKDKSNKCKKDSKGIPYKKGKDPKCEEQEGCIWVPGKGNGCFEKDKSVVLKKISEPKKGKGKCKTYRKTIDPKCEEQDGCKWVKKQGKKAGHCSEI